MLTSNPEQRENCLRIEVTTRCNNECLHCFARAGSNEYLDLPETIAKAIIDESVSCGYEHLHLTGGEPFLWRGIFRTLAHAARAGYKRFFVNSNGTLLSDAVVEQLTAFDNLAISVSLDGPRHIHDRIRGESSYQSAMDGIERALAAGLKVHIFTIARNSLLPLLPRFAEDIFRRLPAIQGLTLIQLIRTREDDRNLSNELLDPDNFISLVKLAALLNRYGFRVDILNNPLANAVAELEGISGLPRSQPLYRSGSIFMMADSKLALAHSAGDSFGFFAQGTLTDVLSSKEFAIATAPDIHQCPQCTHIEVCRSNGMYRPSEWFRDNDQQHPFCRKVLDQIRAFNSDNP